MCTKIKSKFIKITSLLPFIYYYLGPAAFASYFLIGRSLFCRFSFSGVVFGLMFLAYTLVLIGVNGFVDGLYIIRLYWGFVLFYLIFKSKVPLQVDELLIFLAGLTVIEALLINTVISANLLPNFPSIEASSHFASVGNYQRPYSFGGSASVTSVILVALLAGARLGWWGKALVVFANVISMSGSGFFALFIYFLARVPRKALLLIIPAIIFAVYSSEFDKISVDYLLYLLDFKFEQIKDGYSSEFLFLGMPMQASDGLAGGDFAALTFLQYNGLVGVFIFLWFLILNLNKNNWLPILILSAGTFHYGVIFFFPGQLALGYFLNVKSKSEFISCDLSR